MIRFSELPQLLNGKVLQFTSDAIVETLSLDSRKTGTARQVLFLAIKGERHDGHDYIAALYQAGLRNFLIEREMSVKAFPDANILLVDSTISALQQIATHHRSQFSIPVIGITGSNGKTIIKEWLAQLLSPD